MGDPGSCRYARGKRLKAFCNFRLVDASMP